MRLLNGARKTHHIERTKLVSSNEFCKKYKQIIVEPTRELWKYLENSKKRIKMKRNDGNKKNERYGTHQGILTPTLTMP